ncbi:unnamed protein product [marine sediment metagenome]|uniref:Uncharacterized protein n=1 Tax=marine sediment metagenome TaxID=412755 RepID=X1TZS1_9ZZZZ
MTTQLDLFGEAKVAVGEIEPVTEIRLGKWSVRIPLRKQRREALAKLLDILKELEGKDIYIGSYYTGGRHYQVDNLLLRRLQLNYHPTRLKSDIGYIPTVIVLWGSRGGNVRIFTDYLVAVREQEYQGYWHWLLDFRNGFYDSKLDEYRSNYACLQITRFKD